MSGIAETARLIGAHYLTALQHRDFRTLWTASLCAGAAHWALIVARGWLVFDLEGSSIWVGVVTFAAMFPRFFISPFAGLLADRFDRRTVLAGAFGLSIAHNVVLAGLALAGLSDVWYVVVLAVVDGSARAVMMPATGSLVPNLGAAGAAAERHCAQRCDHPRLAAAGPAPHCTAHECAVRGDHRDHRGHRRGPAVYGLLCHWDGPGRFACARRRRAWCGRTAPSSRTCWRG